MQVAMSFSEGMTTNQLWFAVDQDPIIKNQFGGVYPSDHIIRHVPVMRPQIIFANTAPQTHPGKHWVAMYFPLSPNDPVEYFDSTGKNPVLLGGPIKEFFRIQPSGYIYCTKQLQKPGTSVCGEYCLYYAIQRCRGTSMNSIVASIVSDERVHFFVHNYFQL